MKNPQRRECKSSARFWQWCGGSVAAAFLAVGAGMLPAAPPPAPVPAPNPPPALPSGGPSIFDDAPPPSSTQPADPKTVKMVPGPTTAPADAPIVPAPTAGETAQQTFDRIYGPRVRKVSISTGKWDDVNLGRQILADAMQLPPPSDLQKIMLQQAYELGFRTRLGYDLAIAALQNLGNIYPDLSEDSNEKILSIYETASNMPRAKLNVIAPRYIGLIDAMAGERLKENDYDGAVKLYERSIRAEKVLGKDAAWKRQQKVRDLRDRSVIYKKLAALRTSLEKTPDPTMAASYVKLALLDWDEPSIVADAMPLVDEQLRNVATSATESVDTLAEPQAKALGDWYHTNWQAALFGKMPSLGHAHKAYVRALALHTTHDVGWLELKSALGDVQDEEQKLAREIAAKQKADERRDTTVITTKFHTPSNSGGGGGPGGPGGGRPGGGGGGGGRPGGAP